MEVRKIVKKEPRLRSISQIAVLHIPHSSRSVSEEDRQAIPNAF